MNFNKLKYIDILKENKEIGEKLNGNQYNIVVLGNITTDYFNNICEFFLRKNNINAFVSSGNYDNFIQDSNKLKDASLVIIFWELANLIDGFQYKIYSFDKEMLNRIYNKITDEIDITLKNLQNIPLILFNKFSSLLFNYNNIRNNKLDDFCNRLNNYLSKSINSNLQIIDIDKIISNLSLEKSIDLRFYYSSKSLYTIDFYKKYIEFIKPIIFSIKAKTKKALIFDCDNTLWKGVIGEDGMNGIEMSSKSHEGVIFNEIQYLALELKNNGIILGLCSKNNFQDVEEVLEKHPDMVLRNNDFVIKKINWENKVDNLINIAKELNIGLESIVYIDDSSFEIELILNKLPQIKTLQVPTELYNYPKMLRDNYSLFFNLSNSEEDLIKNQIYKEENYRKKHRIKYLSIIDYLKSLNLSLSISIDDLKLVKRMSQLTLKTNQFNLTTKRYTINQIEYFIQNNIYKVFVFNARDIFGSYGITGMCIIELKIEKNYAIIDNYLMSCRVIGRNFEYSFFNFILNYLNGIGIKTIESKYIKTLKNIQVKNFYDELGFDLIQNNEIEKKYILKTLNYKKKNIDYIEVNYE